MKLLALFGILVIVLCTACATPGNSGPRLRHVVLFKFTPETAAADVARIEAAFAALPAQIDTIADFEWGTDVSPEGLARGYTHCFLVTFVSAADRDAYLTHPAHRAFVELVGPHLAEAHVVDYFVRR